ncbi:MAG: hypothetical protein SYC29_17640 [Planctomycetota bacterium]|nr:hypothetical protein [Planctomycetota bacterium]
MNEIEKDLLISRCVQGEACDEEWDRLVALAAEEPRVRRELGRAQRDQRSLAELMESAGAVAERVGLPAGAGGEASSAAREGAGVHPFPRVPAWLGWAVAAVILLAWATHLGPASNAPQGGPDTTPTTNVAGFPTARDAFQSYLDKGREEGIVLSEQPRRVIVQTRPAPSGEGFEVIFVQQIMERAVVPRLYHYGGEDEYGRPTLVRWEGPSRERM